jgi:hypothetical protein
MPSVFELLDHEWAYLGPDPALARRLPEALALTGGRTLGDVIAAEPPLNLAEKDRLHRSVVASALAGDRLAARVELQLLLPGARALAARFRSLGDPEERASATIAAVYVAIHRYALDRRPNYVAPNILVAASQHLRRAVLHPERTVTSPTEWPPTADIDLAEMIAPHPAKELTEVLRDAVHNGVLTAHDAGLIAATRIEARRLADIAETTGQSLRSLQRRRQRAERTLCTVAVAA